MVHASDKLYFELVSDCEVGICLKQIPGIRDLFFYLLIQ
jgi:hypothetical protein